MQIILLFLLIFLVSACEEEKAIDIAEKADPKVWVDENNYIFSRNGETFLFDTIQRTERKSDLAEPSWQEKLPKLYLKPENKNAIFDLRGASPYVIVERSQVFLERLQIASSRQSGASHPMMHRPWKKYLRFRTYMDMNKIGLVLFKNDKPSIINLPLLSTSNMSPPMVMWDSHAGKFLAIQSECAYGFTPEDWGCIRTGWWLNRDLELIKTFALPSDDPLDVGEQLKCFSCGCSCYSREDMYSVNGKIYFHIFGIAVPPRKRGLYAVDMNDDGTSNLRQIIRDNIEPPLAFSPSGCKVAFYQDSHTNNKLKEAGLCLPYK